MKQAYVYWTAINRGSDATQLGQQIDEISEEISKQTFYLICSHNKRESTSIYF